MLPGTHMSTSDLTSHLNKTNKSCLYDGEQKFKKTLLTCLRPGLAYGLDLPMAWTCLRLGPRARPMGLGPWARAQGPGPGPLGPPPPPHPPLSPRTPPAAAPGPWARAHARPRRPGPWVPRAWALSGPGFFLLILRRVVHVLKPQGPSSEF